MSGDISNRNIMQIQFVLLSALLLGVDVFPYEKFVVRIQGVQCGPGKFCVKLFRYSNKTNASIPDENIDDTDKDNILPISDETRPDTATTIADENIDDTDKDNILPVPDETRPACGYLNENGVAFQTSESTTEAKFGEFPWMLAIMKIRNDSDERRASFRCGGSLIHPQVALTTAQCVYDQSASSLEVRAGEWDLHSTKELFPDQNIRVVDIVLHPNLSQNPLLNDVALLFLETQFDLLPNVQTVCLPHVDYNPDLSQCYVTGWGKTKYENEYLESVLKKINLTVVPNQLCQDKLRKTHLGEHFKLDSNFLCAGGEGGKGTCVGDGGSPLVCPISNKNGYFYQAGIVSWGVGCGIENVPGVYANVARFRSWIDEQFASKKMDSSYYTPNV